jgi:hypothetical protein
VEQSELPAPPQKPCLHLHGENYRIYAYHTRTRGLGGIGSEHFGRVRRQLFTYKPFRKMQTRIAHNAITKQAATRVHRWSNDQEDCCYTHKTDPVSPVLGDDSLPPTIATGT